MKKMFVILLACVSIVFGAKPVVKIVYSGSSLGSYTTCGCPGNPTGGMPRMANYLKEYKQQNGSFLLLDAGNFSSKTGREKVVLTEYFMKGMALLKYNAVLVGGGELEHGIETIRRINKDVKLPLVSSNIVDFKGNMLFQGTVRVKGAVKGVDALIVGITASHGLLKEDSSAGFKVLDPVESLQRVLLSAKHDGVVIVLTDLKETALEKFLQAHNDVDLVIVSADYSYREIPKLINGTNVVSSFPETRNIGVVTFDWKNDSVANIAGFNEAMTSKYERHREMDSLFKAYDRALSGVQFKYPRPSDAQKIYAGSESCAECHRSATEKEKGGPHIKAFNVLEKSGNAHNPSCLKCHTTGFERENGFWDVETSMDMAGVQCEECHGPQMAHVREERRRAFGSVDFSGLHDNGKSISQNRPYKVGLYRCAQCHKDEFKMSKPAEEMWKEIGHSK